MPITLGGTAVLAAAPDLAQAYAWAAVLGIPMLAVSALASTRLAGERLSPGSRRRWGGAVLASGALVAVAGSWHGHLLGQAAAVTLTALSACTLASYLAALAPSSVMKAGLVVMALHDAILVFGQLLEAPTAPSSPRPPGAHLPQLQVAAFGTAVVGYGDLFVAAVLGNIITTDPHLRLSVPPWTAAVLLLVCAAAFALIFLAFDVLPDHVPVAAAMLLLDRW